MCSLAISVLGWDVTIIRTDPTGIALEWTRLEENVNRSAQFYIIEVKSVQGMLLVMETVPGKAASTDVKRLRPSTKYRVVIFGVDETGQPYKSLESVVTTNNGMNNCIISFIWFLIIVDIKILIL